MAWIHLMHPHYPPHPTPPQVDIVSTWRQQLPGSSSSGMNTDPLDTNEAEVQVITREPAQTQTEDQPQATAAKQATKAAAGLPQFVQKMEALVFQEILKVIIIIKRWSGKKNIFVIE